MLLAEKMICFRTNKYKVSAADADVLVTSS